MAAGATIEELQTALCKAYPYLSPAPGEMKPTGEIDTGLAGVFKYVADEPWLFKAAVPISTKSAAAIAVYLAGLDRLAPDYANPPEMLGAGEWSKGSS